MKLVDPPQAFSIWHTLLVFITSSLPISKAPIITHEHEKLSQKRFRVKKIRIETKTCL